MTLISQPKQFAYVSGGRCATESIHAALRSVESLQAYDPAEKCVDLQKLYDHHMPARVLRDTMGEETWQNYFTFTFVRNPYSWVVSAFFQRVMSGRISGPPGGLMRLKDFVNTVAYFRSPVGRRHLPGAIRSQVAFIADESGDIIVDFVGRLENLADDYARICERIGITAPQLGHLNSSAAGSSAWRRHYDNAGGARELVEEWWGEDIRRLGYANTFAP